MISCVSRPQTSGCSAFPRDVGTSSASCSEPLTRRPRAPGIRVLQRSRHDSSRHQVRVGADGSGQPVQPVVTHPFLSAELLVSGLLARRARP